MNESNIDVILSTLESLKSKEIEMNKKLKRDGTLAPDYVPEALDNISKLRILLINTDDYKIYSRKKKISNLLSNENI